MLLTACPDNNSSSKGTSSATGSAPTSVCVVLRWEDLGQGRRKRIAGPGSRTPVAVKQGSTINIASAAVGGQQGLGVVMADWSAAEVQSLGMVVDGNALAVSDNMGMKTGSADVKVDGNTYTIDRSGSRRGHEEPMARHDQKNFEITVTCK